ncbi:MAG: hypothetical protein AAFO99_15515, partial [Bacteroidota bacterium]
MRFLVFFTIFSIPLLMPAQDDFLAKQYFNDGEYKKAMVFYEKLVKKNPRRTDYSEGLIASYQQLEAYDKAEAFLLKKISDKNIYPTFFIELGHNYTLQDLPKKANEYYEKALSKIDENPNYGYGIGFRFHKYVLLDYAIKAYSRAMDLSPELDYNFQLARIYGEQGDIEKMYDAYLKLVSQGKSSKS